MKWLVGLGVIVAGALTTFTSAGALSVDYFTIPQYDIQYELSRDSEGRSVLKTTEKITATFSQQDKNHGIERAIPSTYDGHPVSLSIGSVTNENGQSVEYSTREDNGNTIVRIGNPSQYATETRRTYLPILNAMSQGSIKTRAKMNGIGIRTVPAGGSP